MNRHRSTTLTSIAIAAILITGAFSPVLSQEAFAQVRSQDDINIPPYAGNPNTVFRHYQDLGIFGDPVPDCNDIAQAQGLSLTFSEENPQAGPLSQQPDLVDDSIPGELHFEVPNIIDDLDKKLMRIQVTWCPLSPTGVIEPSIVNVNGFEGAASSNMVNEINHVDDVASTLGADYFYEDWELYPNPDWEEFDITFDPQQLVVIQVVIDSWSFSEPVGGTFEGVSTTSLLVAGAKANALWLLPLIGAIGIGIVIVRRKEIF